MDGGGCPEGSLPPAARSGRSTAEIATRVQAGGRTSCMNFLQMPRTPVSLDRVAENMSTCLSCGVFLKIACTSPRMSAAEDDQMLPSSPETKWRGFSRVQCGGSGRRGNTERLQHAVALVKNEVLDFAQVEVAHLGKCLNSAGRADDDVWCFRRIRKQSLLLRQRCAAEDHLRPDVRQVSASAIERLDLGWLSDVGQRAPTAETLQGSFGSGASRN